MADGLLGKCKKCTKKDVASRLKRLLLNPDFHDAEKTRQREKYYRLRYKEKHKPSPENKAAAMKRYVRRYPEKIAARNASQHIHAPDGTERHHWSYRGEHGKDIIILTSQQHAKLHRYMIYDPERMMYRGLDGVLLDTREKHETYITSLKDRP